MPIILKIISSMLQIAPFHLPNYESLYLWQRGHNPLPKNCIPMTRNALSIEAVGWRANL